MSLEAARIPRSLHLDLSRTVPENLQMAMMAPISLQAARLLSGLAARSRMMTSLSW